MNELISKYEKACIGHKENAMKDSELANSFYKQIILTIKELKRSGLLNELKPLLSHPNDGVKSWTAAHYLMVDETTAKEVLKDLVNKGGANGLSAETVIKEWDNGNLKKYYSEL